MKFKTRLAVYASVAGLVAAVGVAILAQPASAHGAMMMPGSRQYLCYEDGLTSTGQIINQNPACVTAFASSGTTPEYNWFAVANRDGATSGETSALIPDGKVCSANSNYFDFSGLDTVSSDWPKTHLTSGSNIQITYNKWAAHPGTFSLYITKPTWDPTKPVSWDELEPTPFASVTDPPSVGNPGSISSYYYWNATLPSGYTGYQIIYSIWARSDSTETFYGCSDVVFDGGTGQVTGVGSGGSSSPTPTPTATSSSPSPSPTVSATGSSPTPTAGSGSGCTAAYQVTSSWQGGFQTTVTVTNNGSSSIGTWKVGWTFANGETITQLWNGTATQAGTAVSVVNASYNGTLGANAATTFGFLGSGTAGTVTGLTCTT